MMLGSISLFSFMCPSASIKHYDGTLLETNSSVHYNYTEGVTIQRQKMMRSNITCSLPYNEYNCKMLLWIYEVHLVT